MDTFTIRDYTRTIIPVLEGFPKGYDRYAIPRSVRRHVNYGNFPMLFQELTSGRYKLAISHYLIRTDKKFTTRANVRCIELHFLLTGKVLINLSGVGGQVLEAGHHNMIVLSDVKNEATFKITPVITFDIHFAVEDFIRLCKKYPQLKPLLKALETNGYSALFAPSAKTNLFMLLLILRINRAVANGKAEDVSTVKLIEELIILVLENKPILTKYNYSYDDIERIDLVHHYIGSYVDEKEILSAKGKESGIRPDKLREGFKLLYGLLPSQYLLEKRLEKAYWLIHTQKETNIESIAEMCGFKTTKQLAKDYYKKYGTKIAE